MLILSLAAAGCGEGRPSMVQATGTVKLDGQPVDKAAIAFQPISDPKAPYRRPSNGVTDAGGKFSLWTYQPNDGIPPGKYKVAVIKQEAVGQLPANYDSEMPGQLNMKVKWIVPKMYASPETSGLEVEVTSSGLQPDTLDLQSGGAKPEVESTGPRSRGNEP